MYVQAALFVFPSLRLAPPTAFGFLRSFTANISSGTACDRGVCSEGQGCSSGMGKCMLLLWGMLLTTHTQTHQFFSLCSALTCLVSFLLPRFSIKRICEIAWKKYNQNCFQMTYNCSPSRAFRRGGARRVAARPSRNYAPRVLTVSQSASVSLDP